jgi:D-3-phosphoglycerate dehydrogenase / 2-oxoglutarate reductase
MDSIGKVGLNNGNSLNNNEVSYEPGAVSFPKNKIKVLLLEGIHPAAINYFSANGYTEVEALSHALSEEELCEKLAKGVHILGIRSKTQVTEKALDAAASLLAIGCFCIGTDQVALVPALRRGIAVFNAPFSNTRSVAELTIAQVVMLARKAAWRSQEMHQGIWNKSAIGCVEVRHKTLGIVGYGHIGPQVGALAEAFGMNVVFYDIVSKLAYGTVRAVGSLDELLGCSDFVTLHVPDTTLTKGMIGARELGLMKKGAHLLNLARGQVVDIEALAASLKSGHLAGAAIDVFPYEPASNDEIFESPLRGIDNVILTPHIGGSTTEAQKNIGLEVADTMVKYIETGSSRGSVNFPIVDLPVVSGVHRVLHIHKNVPGVLSAVNSLVAEIGANITAQFLSTNQDIGYLIMDVSCEFSRDMKKAFDSLDATIKTRLLF